jgi:vacuolar-type H+-ATPase subunit I/STV1
MSEENIEDPKNFPSLVWKYPACTVITVLVIGIPFFYQYDKLKTFEAKYFTLQEHYAKNLEIETTIAVNKFKEDFEIKLNKLNGSIEIYNIKLAQKDQEIIQRNNQIANLKIEYEKLKQVNVAMHIEKRLYDLANNLGNRTIDQAWLEFDNIRGFAKSTDQYSKYQDTFNKISSHLNDFYRNLTN